MPITASLPAAFDASRLATMRAEVLDLAIRQNAYRREAEAIGVGPDMPATHQRVEKARTDTLLLADIETLLTELLRPPAPEPVTQSASVLPFARLRAALGRQPLSRVA